MMMYFSTSCTSDSFFPSESCLDPLDSLEFRLVPLDSFSDRFGDGVSSISNFERVARKNMASGVYLLGVYLWGRLPLGVYLWRRLPLGVYL